MSEELISFCYLKLPKTYFTPNPEQQHIIVLLSRADCTDFIALYRTICLSGVPLIALLLIIGIIIGYDMLFLNSLPYKLRRRGTENIRKY